MSAETVPKGYKRTEVGVIPEVWSVPHEELKGLKDLVGKFLDTLWQLSELRVRD